MPLPTFQYISQLLCSVDDILCFTILANRSGISDVKPDNILVDWTSDQQGNKVVTDVALGDFDIAFKPEGGEPLRTHYALGNAMWRSPEGQTAQGVTTASDVFSFGLVVSRRVPV